MATSRTRTTKAATTSDDSGDFGAATPQILDFTNVKDRGEFNPLHQPEGDYLGKVVKVTQGTSQSGNLMWVFTIELPEVPRASYPYRCVLNENNAWKIRNLFVACGINVPKKRLKVDPSKAVGKTLGVALEDDEYEGKLKSIIAATFPESELPDDEPVRKTSRSTSKTKTRTVVEDDEEVEDDDEALEDEDEMEIDEL